VALLAAAMVPWLAVRDTHVVVALVGGAAALAAVVGAALVNRWRRRRSEDTSPSPVRWSLPTAVLGALSVGLGLLVLVGAAHGERQAFPTRNVYEVRILPYPDRVRWFADHGMPQAEEFLGPDARRPYREPGLPPVVYVPDDDPELGEWLAWVEGDGRTALARFALSHPTYLFREPMRVPERAFNNARGDRSFYEPLDHPHVPLVDALLAHRTSAVLLVAAPVGGWAIGRRRATPALVAGAVTAALALPHGAVAWHSDGMETARHLVVPAIQFHLGVLLMVLGLLPAAATTTREPPPADGVASAHG
jgi:nitrate reductase gamma subunit